MTTSEQRASRGRDMQRVTWISTGVDFALSALKLFIGMLVRSPALIADGLHSLSDLITDFLVLIINKVAHTAPDDEHPYGHARFETLGTMIIGIVLVSIALGLAWDNAARLMRGDAPANASLLAIVTAAFSLVAKELLFRYGMHWAKKLNSTLMEANAWHSRSDAWSSLVVLLGVIATWFGYGWLESWAALVVAALIGKMGVELTWNALQDLADRAIPQDIQRRIRTEIQAVPGVDNVHHLRTRLMGNEIYIDVHIQVSNFISVSEGHHIGDSVMSQLYHNFPDVSDITLHVDPEDDASTTRNANAPLRPAIISALAKYPNLSTYQRMQIHYRQQRVRLELYFTNKPDEACQHERVQAMQDNAWLEEIELYRREVFREHP
ncbi:cation diffusion facilitator family transporter [Salinispirillum marinum]|uniref:Cation diffusion facilitator family transporter n=2 Tax=Saccharospirillaceae TaxID=255527 RepID=A0ABV8BHE1_9GAMM